MHHQPSKIGRIHFIGIGGIGMSGIAKVLLNMGFSVSGSDIAGNAHTDMLSKGGATIFIGHDENHVLDASVVVISSAIKEENPELKKAKNVGIPVVKRAEMLWELMRMKKSIAVSGTHGKTTTTSLVSCLLDKAGYDPTVVNGGVINAYGSNVRLGLGEWIVVEADESDGSFVKLFPNIAIVTNIDPEHMDHYGSVDNLLKAFQQFIHNIPFYGLAILCSDHPRVRDLIQEGIDRRFVTYGLEEGAQIRAVNIRSGSDGTLFDVVMTAHKPGYEGIVDFQQKMTDVFLPMHGKHNVQNVLSLVAVMKELGLNFEVFKDALRSFQGVKRRFTNVGHVSGITLIDDYAHHPVEVMAVLDTAHNILENAPGTKTIAILQPHRYSRLNDLMDDFASVMLKADHVIVTPVYAAGEKAIEGVDSSALAGRIQKGGHPSVRLIDGYDALPQTVASLAQPGDMVIGMGAGSITTWMASLAKDLAILLPNAGHKKTGS